MRKIFDKYFILMILTFVIVSCSFNKDDDIRVDTLFIQAVAYPYYETNTIIKNVDGYGPVIYSQPIFTPIDVKATTDFYPPNSSMVEYNSIPGQIIPKFTLWIYFQTGIDLTNLNSDTNFDYLVEPSSYLKLSIQTENQFLSFCDLIKEHEIININGSNVMTYRIASEQEIMSILDNPDDGDYYLEPLQLNFQNPGITNGEIETKFICDPAGVTNLEVCATNTNMEAYARNICVALQEHYYPLSGIVTLRLTN